MKLFYLFATLFIFSIAASSPIKNIVVLMQENRSFDHVLGHLKKYNPKIDGLNGNESNPLNPKDPNSPRIYVSFDAPDYLGVNPEHSFHSTCKEIWGQDTELNPAPMDGFVWENHQEKQVIQAYNSSTIPVLSHLALEYAVFDRWYSSIPGPTQPNRLMVHSCTSHGRLHDPDWEVWLDGYAPQRTIYNDLYDSSKSWKIYFSDFPIALELSRLRDFPDHIKSILDFHDDAENGKLPDYTFLEPRWFDFLDWKENDQHPPHAMKYGEFLIKDVYQTLRKSPQWNQTLFIILFDEHGGLYDHHSPIQKDVPNPDGLKSKHPPFDFDRLGVRVPMVMISPWIEKGFVEHEAPVNHYDHTSIAHTIRKILELKQPPLTKREAWSGTFEHIFTEKIRNDCPEEFPIPDEWQEEWKEFRKFERLPSDSYQMIECPVNDVLINDLQKGIVSIAWSLGDDQPFNENLTVCQGAKYVRQQLAKWVESKN